MPRRPKPPRRRQPTPTPPGEAAWERDADRLFDDRMIPAAREFLFRHWDAYCEDARKRYESGEAAALFDVIGNAAGSGLRPPRWAMSVWDRCEHQSLMRNSWDAGFGKPFGKGKHARRYPIALQRWRVFRLVEHLHNDEGEPIDKVLFEKVGKELGIG